MSLSLLRQKQIQWAKEREELKHFSGLWGGIWNTEERRYRPCIRSQYKSNLELPIHSEEDNIQRKRTPSLPPINSNYESPQQQQPQEEECNGDTSGYASDSAGNEYNAESWAKSGGWPLPQFPRRTPDSISSGSGREERARWGDRGVGVGHLWEPSPTLPPPPLPKVQPATPNWLNRGPQEGAQVLVISHNEENMTSPPTSSRETIRTCDTPFSSEDSQRSFTRGQNVPIDSAELAERERKRQKALEHQNAIKKQVMFMVCLNIVHQLEEKERIKREEQERNAREERLAEERLKKQQELERQRLEEERRRQKEKEEKDERIAKAMAEALEQAERAAREEKARARRKHLPELHFQDHQIVEQQIQVEHAQVVHAPEHLKEIQKLAMQESPIQQELQLPPPTPEQKIEIIQEVATSTPKQQLPMPPLIKLDRPKREQIQIGEEEQEVELSVRVERLEIEAQDLRVVPPPGRLLTPSRYRAGGSVERSTQTESSGRVKGMRRFLRLEERPKWGVNRPTTQYVKASDRDPFRRPRHPVRTSPRDSSSRSPSPLDNSKASFNSVSSLGKSNATYTVAGSRRSMKVTRGVCTPRIMQVIPTGGIIRKSSAGKRIISIRGNFGNNGTKRLHLPQQDTENVLPKKIEVSEFLSVNQVLSQLIDLKHGLQMKQKEWEITRSPTPFSEVSFKT
ncbi:coiled-coil domain-containing protein 66 isoform X2 [Halyomorpha halys]|uniref:coiled-coil domain-containing protein 66 isoform X2 n=1 Tax=Halyomorpha halys TaxID=286706 RepID=UPI0006D4D7C8|nr:coiled-coil domain-containing protein 66 isoform X2 [Halyomorpha halys]